MTAHCVGCGKFVPHEVIRCQECEGAGGSSRTRIRRLPGWDADAVDLDLKGDLERMDAIDAAQTQELLDLMANEDDELAQLRRLIADDAL